MKPLKEIEDLDDYQFKIQKVLFHGSSKDLVFLDTNILIWIYRLNQESFRELKMLLENLSKNHQLIIPKWVIHEYNSKLNSYSESVFYPFKARLKSIQKELLYLIEVARLISDNELSKSSGYVNKKEFIEQLKSESES